MTATITATATLMSCHTMSCHVMSYHGLYDTQKDELPSNITANPYDYY